MKLLPLLLIFLITSFTSDESVRTDGLYVARTSEISIGKTKMEIFTYLRFYADGTVYTQAVNSYDPEAVSKWFAKDGSFERAGTYKADGKEITFSVSNEGTPDKALEGARADTYTGKVKDDKLVLKVERFGGKDRWVTYKFVKLK